MNDRATNRMSDHVGAMPNDNPDDGVAVVGTGSSKLIDAIVDARLREMGGMDREPEPARVRAARLSLPEATPLPEVERRKTRAVSTPAPEAPAFLEADGPGTHVGMHKAELRAMARRIAARRGQEAHVTVVGHELDRAASLIQRAVGDLMESAGFIWSSDQAKAIERQLRAWMLDTRFYDGAAFRPVREVER